METGVKEARLIARLREFGNRDRAAWDKNYHKSCREHWGVAAPQLDLAICLFYVR